MVFVGGVCRWCSSVEGVYMIYTLRNNIGKHLKNRKNVIIFKVGCRSVEDFKA